MLSFLDNEVLAQNSDGDVSVGQIVIVDTDAVVSISVVLLSQSIQCSRLWTLEALARNVIMFQLTNMSVSVRIDEVFVKQEVFPCVRMFFS